MGTACGLGVCVFLLFLVLCDLFELGICNDRCRVLVWVNVSLWHVYVACNARSFFA